MHFPDIFLKFLRIQIFLTYFLNNDMSKLLMVAYMRTGRGENFHDSVSIGLQNFIPFYLLFIFQTSINSPKFHVITPPVTNPNYL